MTYLLTFVAFVFSSTAMAASTNSITSTMMSADLSQHSKVMIRGDARENNSNEPSPRFLQAKPDRVNFVRVDKSKRRMYLMSDDHIVRQYRVALGNQPKGHKKKEGDNRTPEGLYQLDFVIENSAFHRSVHINYPNNQDIETASLYSRNPGGNIKIHGLKNGDNRPPEYIQSFDWTNGCIAITNQEMDEFLTLVPSGTPIYIEW